MNLAKQLEQFRDEKISKKELHEKFNTTNIKPIMVDKTHLINILKLYEIGKINQNELVEWVNIIWFSDFYEYKPNESSSIASVMSKLEELDENKSVLSSEQVNYYIEILNRNEELGSVDFLKW